VLLKSNNHSLEWSDDTTDGRGHTLPEAVHVKGKGKGRILL